jgi:hypothetical protein
MTAIYPNLDMKTKLSLNSFAIVAKIVLEYFLSTNDLLIDVMKGTYPKN